MLAWGWKRLLCRLIKVPRHSRKFLMAINTAIWLELWWPLQFRIYEWWLGLIWGEFCPRLRRDKWSPHELVLCMCCSRSFCMLNWCMCLLFNWCICVLLNWCMCCSLYLCIGPGVCHGAVHVLNLVFLFFVTTESYFGHYWFLFLFFHGIWTRTEPWSGPLHHKLSQNEILLQWCKGPYIQRWTPELNRVHQNLCTMNWTRITFWNRSTRTEQSASIYTRSIHSYNGSYNHNFWVSKWLWLDPLEPCPAHHLHLGPLGHLVHNQAMYSPTNTVHKCHQLCSKVVENAT
jgi:hypothetical protein